MRQFLVTDHPFEVIVVILNRCRLLGRVNRHDNLMLRSERWLGQPSFVYVS